MERPGLCWEKNVCFWSPSSCLYVGFIFLKGITGYGTGSSRYILWVSLTWEKNISSICSSNCLGLTFTGSDWPGVAHGPIPEPIIVSTVSETHPWISETGLASPESTGLRVQGVHKDILWPSIVPLGGIDSWQAKAVDYHLKSIDTSPTTSPFKELTGWCNA